MTPSDLNSQDSAFLHTVKEWMSEPGTTTYLIGPESGSLTLDITSKRFGKSPDHAMSQELRAALISEGVINAQASAHQTHRFLKGASDFPLRSDILKDAAIESDDLSDTDEPGMW